jgi:WhiB family redox-sensing transcriptional regulator
MINTALRDQAACASPDIDPDIFFPADDGLISNDAKRICNKCPVMAECLEFALSHNEKHGVWGGLSLVDRAKLMR